MNKWVYVAVELRCQVVPLLFLGQRPTVISQFWKYPQQKTKGAETKCQTNWKICH